MPPKSITAAPEQAPIDQVRTELTEELVRIEAVAARLRSELEQTRDQRHFVAGQLAMLARIVPTP